MSKADKMFKELGYEVDWESDEEKTIENLRKNKGVSFAEADIILNLIDKQSKEIEELNKTKDNIQVVYGGRRFGTEGIVVKDYISKDKIIEILDKEREKAKERYDSRLDISKQIYKREVQIAMIDTIKNKLVEE